MLARCAARTATVRNLFVLILLAGMLSARPAHALAVCTVSASSTAFGSYSMTNLAPLDASGNVQVSCSLEGLISLLISYDIALSTGASGSYAARTMNNGANVLQYNLYTTSGHAVVWGDGTAGSSIVSDSYLLGLSTTVRNYTVHGRMPASQNTPAGAYLDTITVTVTY